MICRDCGQDKALEGFYQHPLGKNGRMNICKECKRGYEAQRRAINLQDPVWAEQERKRQVAKQCSTAGMARMRRWRKLNPEKYAAHLALDNAVRDGRVPKPCACSRCSAPTWPLHGHHADYSKPLDVTWLCAKCHHAPTQESIV